MLLVATFRLQGLPTLIRQLKIGCCGTHFYPAHQSVGRWTSNFAVSPGGSLCVGAVMKGRRGTRGMPARVRSVPGGGHQMGDSAVSPGGSLSVWAVVMKGRCRTCSILPAEVRSIPGSGHQTGDSAISPGGSLSVWADGTLQNLFHPARRGPSIPGSGHQTGDSAVWGGSGV